MKDWTIGILAKKNETDKCFVSLSSYVAAGSFCLLSWYQYSRNISGLSISIKLFTSAK
ncbi:hypothetical protein M2109_001857 [Paenibacillus sp. PastH-3]|nr:hypothetical protein [Paenibacillus sp. PastH-4]MDH6443631.1 hypothetical protein [Paenibacillus sp. PastF-4]MDH6527540.1 hypothetical protein [Paenibacillus sp. PastH-3]